MEPDGSLPHSKERDSCSYAEADQSGACLPTTSWRSILILSCILSRGLSSCVHYQTLINTLKNGSTCKLMTHGLQMDCNNIWGFVCFSEVTGRHFGECNVPGTWTLLLICIYCRVYKCLEQRCTNSPKILELRTEFCAHKRWHRASSIWRYFSNREFWAVEMRGSCSLCGVDANRCTGSMWGP